MNNKFSTIALILAGLVCGFLILEWFNPTSSLKIFLSMEAVAVIDIVLAIMGIRKQKSALSIIALAAAAVSAGIMIIIFGIMLIMGMGA